MKNWWYYLHSNGDLIGKNPVVVESDPSYFDSPFVKKTWLIDTENRQDAWLLCIEALALGAQVARVKELSEKWKLTLEDLPNLIIRISNPSQLQIDGLVLFIVKILELDYDKTMDDLAALGDKK